MPLASYTQLKTAVQDWLDDYTYAASTAADWITLGEKRIKRDLKISQMEARALALTSTTTRFMSLPSNAFKVRHLQLNTNPLTHLEFKTPEQMDGLREASAGKPYYFSISANQIELNRISDEEYTAEIDYYKLTPLVAMSQETNEIFPEFSDLYLFASIAEGLAFLHEDSSVFEGKYLTARERVMMSDEELKFPEGSIAASPNGTVW